MQRIPTIEDSDSSQKFDTVGHRLSKQAWQAKLNLEFENRKTDLHGIFNLFPPTIVRRLEMVGKISERLDFQHSSWA